MSQGVDVVLVQLKGLHSNVHNYSEDTEITEQVLAKFEAKLQCLEGLEIRFSAHFPAFQDSAKTRDQQNAVSAAFTEFWRLHGEVNYKIRYWIAKLNRVLNVTRPESGQSINSTVQVIMSEQKKVMEDLMSSHRQDMASLTGALQKQSTGTKIKLPQLQIPTFSGKYTEWQGFHDIFEATIHKKEDLSNIEKFQYLKSALTGTAASLLKNLSLSDANYSEAWTILRDRYDKKTSIIADYVKAFHSPAAITHTDAVKLRGFANICAEVTHGLEALESLKHDPFMIHVALSKVDPETRSLWFREISEEETVDWKFFIKFLDKRCDALEMGSATASEKANVSTKPQHSAKPKTFITTQASQNCVFCTGEAHKIFQCPKFLSAPSQQRLTMAKEHKLCWNCLRTGHQSHDCRSSNCKTCQQKHNTLLHEACQSKSAQKQSSSSQQSESQVQSSSSHGTQANVMITRHVSKSHQVLLPTIEVLVSDNKGRFHKCRALLDSCSQPNCIASSFAQKLGLPMRQSSLQIGGIGASATDSAKSINITICSQHEQFSMKLECVVLKRITEKQPSSPINLTKISVPENIPLADLKFNEPGEIELLLGAEVFMKCLRSNHISGNPSFLETAFGYVAAGECQGLVTSDLHSTLAVCLCATHEDILQEQVAKFINAEEIEDKHRALTAEEQSCEDHFVQNFIRKPDGRYMVRLPRKIDVPSIGNTLDIADRRLLCQERRRRSNPLLDEMYRDFMRQYIESGHMKLLPDDYTSPMPQIYLCHHPVFKQSSTTPLRVVFDASAKSSNGVSLNSTLMVGPKLQQDVFSNLTRGRKHFIVIKADFSKMFRQVEMHPDDQNSQRIRWREFPWEEIQTFLLTTVTYGMASSSFLAVRVAKQIVKDEGDNYPLIKEAADDDFYMDDLLTGANDVQTAITMQKQFTEMFKKGGFVLRKWASNSPEVLANISAEDREDASSLDLGNEDCISTLGMHWNPSKDLFLFSSKNTTRNDITKRIVLSQTSQTFDPLGLISPLIVRSKILLQSLWKLTIGWDEYLPTDIQTKWTKIIEDMQNINKIQIPRAMSEFQHPQKTEIFAFGDASEQAYAACVYIKTTYDNGVCTRLLCSKTKVSPLKKISIPRLELCAATLLVRLLEKTKEALKIKIDAIYAFSDARVVLHWIYGDPQRWKVFVANRVSQIQSILPPEHWHYVKSEENPADLASRGADVSEIINHSLWWSGPSWIAEFQGEGEPPEIEELEGEDLEERKVHSLVTTVITDDFFERFSSVTRLIRSTAYVLRFLHNRIILPYKQKRGIPSEPLSGNLSVEELTKSRALLIKFIQEAAFPDELHSLKQNAVVERTSNLVNLHPFLDEHGVMRVGGRIQRANVSFDQKHPILLPKGHRFTRLLAVRAHNKTLHGGPQATLAQLRTEYWPIRGIDVVKQVIRKCIICFQAKPMAEHQLMGSCPNSRVEIHRPFHFTGVDYCGPVYIKPNMWSKVRQKMYIAIFTCLTIRAIHIELVTDMTTEAFLAALQRFIARRNKPFEIWCDNAKTFEGAEGELDDLKQLFESQQHQDRVIDSTANNGIKFVFIPPRSPHFGGTWESMVKRTKHHLYRVVASSYLTQEKMITLLTQIEMCINSRPITPMSTDPTDVEVLTPAHFLVGSTITMYDHPDLTHIPENRLGKWQLIQQMQQHFWKRWSNEFLQSLQKRKKWQQQLPSIKVGDLVLMREDNTPSFHWPRGRVAEVIPGPDGLVRVAIVQTGCGKKIKFFKRSIVKLSVLPMEESLKQPFQPGQNGHESVEGVVI